MSTHPHLKRLREASGQRDFETQSHGKDTNPTIELRPYQIDAIQNLRRSIAAGNKRIVLQASTGAGKCLSPETPIIMSDATIKPIKEIRVGDKVLGDDGTFRNVLATTSGISPMYRIKPTRKGFDDWSCNDQHIMTLVTNKKVNGWDKDKVLDIPIQEYLGLSKTSKHCTKQYSTGFDGWGQVEFPIDPYMIGIWLGDGSSRHSQIWSTDQEVIDYVYEYAKAANCTVTVCTTKESCYGYSVVTPRGQVNPTWTALKEFVVDGVKQIPAKYLASSRKQRLSLLAGLLDTDGYHAKGSHEIVQKSEVLADSIQLLARSLGIRVSRSIKHAMGKDYHRLLLSGDFTDVPFRVPRRIPPPSNRNRDPLRTGFDVERLSVGAYVGIVVDGNSRFLKSDFTVVHNTVISAEIARSAYEKGKRSAFICDSIDLIDQTVESYRGFGLPIGVMQADSILTDTSAPIQICTAQTLDARLKKYPEFFQNRFDLIQIDECHEQRAIRETISELNPNAPFLGYTATPYAKGMGLWWDDLVLAIPMQNLIEQGFLVPYHCYAPNQISLDGLKDSSGDFNQEDAAKKITNRVVADVANTWMKLGEGRPTIGFAPNVASSKMFCEEFKRVGVSARHVDGYAFNDEQRRLRFETIQDFRDGKFDVLWSVALTIKGFDVPRVSCIVDCQPTKSLSRHVQKWGRAMRISPGTGKTNARVIDHVGNVQRNGFPADAGIDELDTGKKGEASDRKKDEPMPKACPACNFMKPPKTHKCPKCGFSPERKADVEVIEGDIVEYGPGAQFSTGQKTEWMYMLNYIRIQKGYKKGWSIFKFKSKFDEEPPVLWPQKTIPPSPEVINWLKHEQIKYVKRKAKNAKA